jgi:hypothetical protein
VRSGQVFRAQRNPERAKESERRGRLQQELRRERPRNPSVLDGPSGRARPEDAKLFAVAHDLERKRQSGVLERQKLGPALAGEREREALEAHSGAARSRVGRRARRIVCGHGISLLDCREIRDSKRRAGTSRYRRSVPSSRKNAGYDFDTHPGSSTRHPPRASETRAAAIAMR